ncbi:Maf family protein, partial [Corynebacterium nasicanis]
MRIVLASSSPSRRMILVNAGVDPLIRPADVDEDALLAAHEGSPAAAVAAL